MLKTHPTIKQTSKRYIFSKTWPLKPAKQTNNKKQTQLFFRNLASLANPGLKFFHVQLHLGNNFVHQSISIYIFYSNVYVSNRNLPPCIFCRFPTSDPLKSIRSGWYPIPGHCDHIYQQRGLYYSIYPHPNITVSMWNKMCKISQKSWV